MRSRRFSSGCYGAEYLGHEIMVLRISEGTRSFWNIVIDGECDECALTKRDALETARSMVEEMVAGG